jgi:SAM-dependent methyltransferase
MTDAKRQNQLLEISKSYLEWAPLSLTIREITRIHALYLLDDQEKIFEANKILDVGCGDGRWWIHMLPDSLHKVHGVDISKNEVSLATKLISTQCLDIAAPDFLEKIKFKKFDLIIGNCSLEHVYHIDLALENINSVLNDGGVFILLVPTPSWALKGKSVRLLNAISPRLAMSFSGLINGFFQHWHLYNYQIWSSLLKSFNFKIKTIFGIGNSKSEFLFRLALPMSFISFLVKSFLGKYLNYYLMPFLPLRIKNILSTKIVSSINDELQSPKSRDIFEYMIVCTK